MSSTGELSCGCRPADRWCPTARKLRDEIHDAIALATITPESEMVEAKRDIAEAERALRDHLRGEAA